MSGWGRRGIVGVAWVCKVVITITPHITTLFITSYFPRRDSGNKGSEHLFNNTQYPMEMHLVNYNSKYPNASAALASGDKDALAGIYLMAPHHDLGSHGSLIVAFRFYFNRCRI